MTLPLFLRRLICRLRGHDSGRIVKYGPREVLVGEGCQRCEVGSVRSYATVGPLPAALKDARTDSFPVKSLE
jgi:hypothetical protein